MWKKKNKLICFEDIRKSTPCCASALLLNKDRKKGQRGDRKDDKNEKGDKTQQLK